MELKGPKVKKDLRRFIAGPEKKVRLKDRDTSWSLHPSEKSIDESAVKDELVKRLEQDRARLEEAQELLIASRKYGLLIILQGMDTAGKDGTIRHVMSGVNPQGCNVQSFKVPTAAEHAHDFLWRYSRVLPERGMIGIFNRSYYEDVIVVNVHPERLEPLPDQLGSSKGGFWSGRYKDINAFEKHLVRNGTVILKFFLHISPEEQRRRLLDRLEHKKKYWKFSSADLAEREYWDQYTRAYEEMLSATSTEYAPWFIVPADNKWAARTFVADTITTAINGLNLSLPEVSAEELRQLLDAKKKLDDE
jgi:PPK2 family polyphosphate:nucleotide phosphotransferase